ncbi:hypothetical protein JC794_16345 [Morganella morganii]|uniref:hypothetical protein n=1 Tax=Morganella morganii TaxID=582 RepID=UPI000EDB9B07|nr:hypothetical protein [Morganella morganii]HAE76624.1 hypothetical protein [Morganella sp. (in: enterobacteria)]QXO45655.1 hypothetical protein JC862_15160 [Morganella morganii]QXO53175.1 hypothetical protein JC830_15990 [Morganella morganii]QXO57053.1 hypothetical protein JC827_16360 [Morganella morganii]QXO76013.1 hypothetical protein JC794_16345 [Morganella morganii]
MKERGVIFNSEMVRAILAGRKTQTRRIVKSVPTTHDFHGWIMSSTCAKDEGKAVWAIGDSPLLKDPIRLNCPLGKIGDRLWVRETWQGPLVDYENANKLYKDPEPFQTIKNCVYKADGDACPEYFDADDNLRYGWKSSAQMPHWASRILLEITGVRIERLQDISEDDAVAEGVAPLHGGYWKHYQPGWTQHQLSARGSFVTLWNSINGVDAWYKNPWVWVIEFRRVTP